MYENESTFVLDFYTKDMRLYSIIIPVYNRPDELDDLLSSLCKQTYVHFEVIVVEDGSEIPAWARPKCSTTVRTPRAVGPPLLCDHELRPGYGA